MNTVSDFRKSLKVGTKLGCTFHMKFNGRDEKGNALYTDEQRPTREVSRVMSSKFALKTTRQDGRVEESFCEFPKATQASFENDRMTIYEHDDRTGKQIPILTYWIVNE